MVYNNMNLVIYTLGTARNSILYDDVVKANVPTDNNNENDTVINNNQMNNDENNKDEMNNETRDNKIKMNDDEMNNYNEMKRNKLVNDITNKKKNNDKIKSDIIKNRINNNRKNFNTQLSILHPFKIKSFFIEKNEKDDDIIDHNNANNENNDNDKTLQIDQKTETDNTGDYRGKRILSICDENEVDENKIENIKILEIYNNNNDIYDIINEKSILDIRNIERLVNNLRLKIKDLNIINFKQLTEINELKEIIRLEPEIAQKGTCLCTYRMNFFKYT